MLRVLEPAYASLRIWQIRLLFRKLTKRISRSMACLLASSYRLKPLNGSKAALYSARFFKVL